MNARLTQLLIPAAMFTFTACAGATDPDAGSPPDAEFGIESADGRADSYGVRPGSPEAEAVLAFTNQPLANPTEAANFFTLLDTELHKTAARNIVAYRAGDDGVQGTADDQTFGELKDLDGVSYVGRVALMSLHDLAIAAGYGQQGEVNCSEYMTPRNGRFEIRDYEDLLVIEQSGCTVIDGDLSFHLFNHYMPTRARKLQSLDAITKIQGNLDAAMDDSAEVLAFRGLKEVGGYININASDDFTVEMPELVTANAVTFQNVASYEFPKLQTIENVNFRTNQKDISGFPALEEVGQFTIYKTSTSDLAVDFPALKRATRSFTIQGAASYAKVKGGFAALTNAHELYMYRMSAEHLEMPKLESVSTKFALNDVSEGTAPFDALETVGGRLELTNLGFRTSYAFKGFNGLKAVGEHVRVQVADAVEFDGFKKLETIGTTMDVSMRCRDGKFEGFNELVEVGSITVTADDCNIRGFDSLEELPGNLSLREGKSLSGFGKLSLVGQNFTFITDGDQDFPSLEVVGGNFSYTSRGTMDMSKFDALEIVEGNFALRGPIFLTGLLSLDGIGANASFPRGADRTQVDRILDQLSQFSGSVTFN